MSQFAFYDFETTGTSPAFDQALQFAAILTDEDLNPLEEINVRCNLSDHILPSPIAFSVTGITPDVLNSQEMSYYDFSIYLYNLIARWSPSIWTGYNSISFDENFFRQMFYQNLLPEIYSTQFNGNKRFDLLRAVYACWGYGRANPAIPQLDNGKLTSKLDTLAPHNGFNEHNAHDALGDVRATIFVAKLIRDREPDIWNILMQNLDKDHLKSTFEAGNVLEIVERYGAGAPKRYQGVYCGESGSNRNQLGFFDLNQADAAAFANADIDQVKAAVEKSPKLIRTVDLNKMPLAFGVQNVTLKMGSDAAMVSANANLRALVGTLTAKNLKM
jgi:exodeoxyribonuclease-1